MSAAASANAKSCDTKSTAAADAKFSGYYIQIPQARAGRMTTTSVCDGLFTDAFGTCVIVIMRSSDSTRMSLLHHDQLFDPTFIQNEWGFVSVSDATAAGSGGSGAASGSSIEIVYKKDGARAILPAVLKLLPDGVKPVLKLVGDDVWAITATLKATAQHDHNHSVRVRSHQTKCRCSLRTN